MRISDEHDRDSEVTVTVDDKNKSSEISMVFITALTPLLTTVPNARQSDGPKRLGQIIAGRVLGKAWTDS